MKLWYNSPAEGWEKALPIGNGRLGGMVKSGINKDHLQINEDSVWYGGPRDRNNPDTNKYLDKIRNYILDGKVKKAEKIMQTAMTGLPENQRHYEPFLDLEITTGHQKEKIENYKRELDLKKAAARASYSLEDTRYIREYFVSAVDQIMVIRFSSEGSKNLNLQVRLRRLGRGEQYSHYIDRVIKNENQDMIILKGGSGSQGRESGINFYGGLKVKTMGGNQKIIGDNFQVRNAEAVIFFITGATDFYHNDPRSVLEYQLNAAYKKTYSELQKDHINEYKQYFERVSLNIESEDYSHLPTDKRRQRFEEGHDDDQSLITLYFNFGRYLLISCSRPGTQAANLQGIWNDRWLPPWDSKYTININLEMNYWPAEVCNLSELHQPLFALIKKMHKNGQKTADIMYNADGFCAHHNTDIWGDTAPQGSYLPASYWPMGAAWLCTHFWEHYAYTQNEDFLKEIFPVMKDACKFFFDYLIEDEQGRLVTCPSVSPENTYILKDGKQSAICAGPAVDAQIIRFLMKKTIKMSEIINNQDKNNQDKEKEFIAKAEEICRSLPKPGIGQYGQLKEWRNDYEEAEPGHRHISHLWALHPGDQISPEKNPKLAEAAEKSLRRRLEHGGGHTGWSRAWIINFWARLYKPQKAYQNIIELLKTSTLDNLFDNHPPFQIDGNFGSAAGIAEMLLQSHQNCLHLLPALPDKWSAGSVKGLCARGGFEVDIYWEDSRLKKAVIRSKVEKSCKIKYKENRVKINMEQGDEYVLDCNLK